MQNVAVIYKSNYGTTQQYAAWIAEELGAELLAHQQVKPKKLQQYDYVIYGGGLYAGGILGVDLVIKNYCKKLIIFTVGLADPASTNYADILNKNLPAKWQDSIKVFHLRGGIDYKKLGFVHRAMMAMMKKMTIGKKPYNELSDEDKAFIENYGTRVDFTDRQAIKPMIEYINNRNDKNFG